MYLGKHHGVVDVGGDDAGGQAVGRVVSSVYQLLDHIIGFLVLYVQEGATRPKV